MRVRVTSRFNAGEAIATASYSTSDFTANCGYSIFSTSNRVTFERRLDAETKETIRQLIYKSMYNRLISDYSYYQGGRKIVMSGSFSSYNSKYNNDIGNGTAKFMLCTPTEFVGEATKGKESGIHFLQLGEINIKEEMPRADLKGLDKLYAVSFNSGW